MSGIRTVGKQIANGINLAKGPERYVTYCPENGRTICVHELIRADRLGITVQIRHSIYFGNVIICGKGAFLRPMLRLWQ